MIFIIHGVVPRRRADRISHALFLPESGFAEYLRLHHSRFVPLIDAIKGSGDALTIDDATYGGMKAALLAREHGHEVTWFVNGANSELKMPYFPFQLSYMLDETEKSECFFDERRWRLDSLSGRRALRLYLKQLYMQMKTLGEITDLVEQISDCVEADPARMERALCTATSEDLAVAVAAGVDIQNHGWTHLNPNCLSETQRVSDILANEEYLAFFRNTTSRMFAPPYGEEVRTIPGLFDYMLLSNRKIASTHLHGNKINRLSLELSNPMLLAHSLESTSRSESK